MSCAQHNAWHTAGPPYLAAFRNVLELESSLSDSKVGVLSTRLLGGRGAAEPGAKLETTLPLCIPHKLSQQLCEVLSLLGCNWGIGDWALSCLQSQNSAWANLGQGRRAWE